MAETCDTARKGAADLIKLNDIIDEGTLKQEEELGWTDIPEDINAEIIVEYLAGQVVPQEKVKDFIKNTYGEHWERYWIATKIVALSSANPMISEMIKEYIWKYMPSGFHGDSNTALKGVKKIKNKKTGKKERIFFGTGGLTREAYNKLDKKAKLKVALKVMSKEDLMTIYHEIHKWVTAGTGENWAAKGLIGKFLLNLKPSTWFGGKELSKRERSGAYYKFTQHITKYYTMIDNDIGNFMVDRVVAIKHKDGTTTTKKVKGMDSIFKEVTNLANTIEEWDPDIDYRQSKGDIFFELFSMIMNGEVVFKDGKFIGGYKDYGPLKEGKVWKTHKDGTLKHIYSNLVSLDSDEFYGGKFEGLEESLTKRHIKQLEKSIKEARKIDNTMFKTLKKQQAESAIKLIESLNKHFPDLNENELTTLFFEEWKTISHIQIIDKLKELDKSHKKGYIKKYNKFKSTFGNLASVSRFVTQATDSDYQKNHWPKKYHKATFDIQWDNYIESLKIYIEAMESEINELKSGEYKITEDGESRLATKEETKALLKKAQKELGQFKFRKKRAEAIRDNTSLYPEDSLTMNNIPFLKDQKHLKSISGAFDIRLARKDVGVYRAYVEESFSAINRNKLTTTLLDSLLISESEAVDNTLINFYKVPFNDPSIIGFGGVSENQLAKAFSGLKKNIKGSDINRIFRRVNKYLTASKLGGIGTAIVNKAALAQTIQDRNFALTSHARKFYTKNQDEMQKFITRAGVASFKDFFNKAVLNGKAGFELDNATAERIYAIMLNYPKLIEQFESATLSELKSLAKKYGIPVGKLKKETIARKIAEKEIQAEFRTVLNKSSAFNLRIDKILSKEDIESRRKKIRSTQLDSMLDKYVQYALTYEFDLNKYAFEVDWHYTPVTKVIQKGLKGIYTVTGKLMKEWGKFRQEAGLTMSDSEAWIRTISFTASVIQAQKLGYVRGDVPMWELEGEDMRLAMELGRLGSNYSNMGLSSTDVGQQAWGSHGNFMHKFNIWALQKRGRDARIMRNATTVQKELWELGRIKGPGGAWINTKAISKAIAKALVKWPQVWKYKEMNVAQKQQAHLVKFLNIGVLPALLMDFIVWGPIGTLVGFSILRAGMRGLGFEHGIRGLPSQMAQVVTMAIAQIIRMSMDDDEWETDKLIRFLQQYSRNVFPLGYGGNFGWDWMLLVNYIATEEYMEATQQAIPDIVPIPKEVIKELFKTFD